MIAVLGCILLAAGCLAELTCRNAQGESVDWYIGYKLPLISDTDQIGTGFLYADMQHPSWSLPEDINSTQSSVGQTLAQYYANKQNPEIFYMMYNDAHPGGKGDGYRGHTKGTVVFDEHSGFWLIDSVPNFPDPETYYYPESGMKNGQSFLCISFKGEDLAKLVTHFMYTMPSIYNSNLPTSLAAKFEGLQDIVMKKSIPKGTNVFYTVQKLTSALGTMEFTAFAKHKKFNADLYADLLAPYTGCSYYAETWLNGPNDYENVCNTTDKNVRNVATMKVDKFEFSSSKDHSKWAVAEDAKCGYLCIGDINRQISQSRRAGGTLCFQHLLMWDMYRKSVQELEPCPI